MALPSIGSPLPRWPSRAYLGIMGVRHLVTADELEGMGREDLELVTKAGEYIDAGTLLVWVVDPRTRTVRVHQPGQPAITLSSDAMLDGAEVLPGFTLPLSRLFAEVE